ncbi:glycosyl hydrolase family 18 protein [Vallitaleaceae bacterium 9-2]
MKTYIKPLFIGLIGLVILGLLSFFVINIYKDFKAAQQIQKEVQVDFTTVYEGANSEALATIYDGKLIDNGIKPKFLGGILYLPVGLVSEYINDQFHYDAQEKILTYTTQEDVIRMRTDELTYTVNDEPIRIEIGMTEFDGEAYLPLSLVQKFSHHDFIHNEEYHVLQIKDWYSEETTGEVYYEGEQKVYIRILPYEEAAYLHVAYVGMDVVIVGEEDNYYQVLTKEGFLGYIQKENVRSVVTSHSVKEKVYSYKQFPGTQFDEKINLVWHQVFNTTANQYVQERLENVTGANVISPTWFELKGTEGEVKSIADLNYVRWAHDNGYQVWALFANLGEGYTRSMTHEVLSSTTKRMEVIRQLLALASVYELDGINIDLENIGEETGPYYVQFVKELSIYSKQQGLIVSADLPVPKPWTEHMGREEIAKYLDYFIIMGYDEHWSTSPVSGSVASIGFVEEGIVDTLKSVPKEKVILGVPFYTRLWKEETVDGEVKVSSKAYGMDGGQTIVDENNIELEWDEQVGQYYGEYYEGDIRYRIWLEDDRAMDLRMQLIDEYELGGVAGWKLGLESDSVWEVIRPYLKKE